jgi:hypothetical protein
MPPVPSIARGATSSRFGDISPGFAAAFGASVSIGLLPPARNAEARAFAGAARRERTGAASPALPLAIGGHALPASRVRAGLVCATSTGSPLPPR